MKVTHSIAITLLLTALHLPAAGQAIHRFRKVELTTEYWSEGATFGDFNRDGHTDVVSGPFWYKGPDFRIRHAFYSATQSYKVMNKDRVEETIRGFRGFQGKETVYADNFFAYVYDFNRDGWPDILTIGFPGKEAALYENPAGKALENEDPWSRHVVVESVDNESPMIIDLPGGGRPALLCMHNNRIGYFTPDWAHPTAHWMFHPISLAGDYGTFTHGLGFGDVNGDGRGDILDAHGWWQQPPSLAKDPPWLFHKFEFAHRSSQMHVYDVNRDGLADVITALDAHGYGLAWYEQLKQRKPHSEIDFTEHVIMGSEPGENPEGVRFSQLHAVEVIDMDGDGVKDIVTGKRFWAHGPAADPEPNAPAVLYWFRLVHHRVRKVEWVPYLIDDNSGIGSQIAVGNVNRDRYPDVVVGNRKGTFVFLQEGQSLSGKEKGFVDSAVSYGAISGKTGSQ